MFTIFHKAHKENATGIEYATLNRRMIAATLDLLIIAIFFTPLFSMIEGAIYGEKTPYVVMLEYTRDNPEVTRFSEILKYMSNIGTLQKYFTVQISVFIIIGLFMVVFWYFKGATPGKMILRCRIQDAESGERPSIMQYITRFVGYVLSVLTLFFGFFAISMTKRRQGLHDKLAGTVVIVKEKKSKKDPKNN